MKHNRNQTTTAQDQPASGDKNAWILTSLMRLFSTSGEKNSTIRRRSGFSAKIAGFVFLTTLIVQVAITAISYHDYKQDLFFQSVDTARASLASFLNMSAQSGTPENAMASAQRTVPLSAEAATLLLQSTAVMGVSAYDLEFRPLKRWGAVSAPDLRVMPFQGVRNARDMGFHVYEEILIGPDRTGWPYYFILRLDTQSLAQEAQNYLVQSALIAALFSTFLTTILMIGLGYWYLNPIMVLTGMIRKASEHPEDPDIAEIGDIKGSREIAKTIRAAQKLIRDNAAHIKDIRSHAEDKIHQLAYYDSLTGLPNRTQFIEKLRSFNQDNATPKPFVVVTLDLDHFRDVNDSMGHHIGDVILKSVGERLKKTLPPSALVARAGEDEFAVMMPLTSGGNKAEDVARKVAQMIKSERFIIMEEEFRIHCSVGFALFPEDGEEPEQVLKNADIALNRAKEDGRDMVRAYSRDFDLAVQSRFQLLRDLRLALEEQQFELHYQPQFNIQTGQIIGAEGLLRWWKPTGSKEGGHYISPGEFIPIAESSGLIVPIGEWVLRQSCAYAKKLNEETGRDIRIAVNVSGVQFRQKDLVDTVAAILDETGLKPELLEIEVTESSFMDDIQYTISVLKSLNDLGVELAIDDFGTGYSSLAYLRQFPIDRLKIDRSFIMNALSDSDDASIARTIIALGRALGLQVLAEGVETREHEQFLINEGCDEVQGFRYAKPLPEDKFRHFIDMYSGDLAYFDESSNA